MSTVVQTAEHVVIDSAKAVVSQVVKSDAGDLKTIESSVVKEVVSATDEPVHSLLDKVQAGVTDVGNEVFKGAEATVQAVEQHPELIAEGALAVVIGAASLVQPELATGEIAIIGKMAADGAKKTVSTIASDAGSKVVKAIAKDVADDAQTEQSKDGVNIVGTGKADAAMVGKAASTEALGAEAAAVKTGSNAPNGSLTSSSGTTVDPKSASVINAEAESTTRAAFSSDARTTSTNDSGLSDKTIAINIAAEPPTAISKETRSSSTSKAEPPPAVPISLKITLGADGEVKAVTQGDLEQRTTNTTPVSAPELTTSKATTILATTKTAIVATQPPRENGVETSEKIALSPQRISDSGKKPETVQDVPQPITSIPNEKAEAVAEPTAVVAHPPSLGKIPDTIEETPEDFRTVPNLSGPVKLSALTTVTSTTPSTTISNPILQETVATSDSSKMVTVSQESLDLLHQKIDVMHEAIHQITKVLAFHMPLPASDASRPTPIAAVEAIIDEAMATPVMALTDLLPELVSRNDDSSHPPMENPLTPMPPRKRPSVQKQTSVLGSIGKMFWPFSSLEKVVTTTVTEVNVRSSQR